jgi:hypothetical protein
LGKQPANDRQLSQLGSELAEAARAQAIKALAGIIGGRARLRPSSNTSVFLARALAGLSAPACGGTGTRSGERLRFWQVRPQCGKGRAMPSACSPFGINASAKKQRAQCIMQAFGAVPAIRHRQVQS